MSKLNAPVKKPRMSKLYELYIIHDDNTDTKVDNPEEKHGLFLELFHAMDFARKKLQLESGDMIDVREFKIKK